MPKKHLLDILPPLTAEYSTKDKVARAFAERTQAFLTAARPTLLELAAASENYGPWKRFPTDPAGVELAWFLDDPENLTGAPQGMGRWEEKLSLHTPGWSHQARLEFVRNRFGVGTINLDSQTHESSIGGITAVDVNLEATAANSKDQLCASYSTIWGGWGIAAVTNGAPALRRQLKAAGADLDAHAESVQRDENYMPTPDDLILLGESAKILADAIETLRAK